MLASTHCLLSTGDLLIATDSSFFSGVLAVLRIQCAASLFRHDAGGLCPPVANAPVRYASVFRLQSGSLDFRAASLFFYFAVD